MSRAEILRGSAVFIGRSQNIPDKGSAHAEYPDTTIVPGFDLDEPDEPDTP